MPTSGSPKTEADPSGAARGIAGDQPLIASVVADRLSGSFELISAFLLLHEMPQDTTRRILREARRLLQPGGSLAVMDMNPACGAYQTMPAAIMTLLKSTEPFLDAYFGLDLEQEMLDAGFDGVTSRPCSPRHRAVVATVRC